MLIHVKVTADANKESLEMVRETSFKISVKEPAQDNRANRRIIEILAVRFNVPTSKIKIITGHHMPGKILEIGAPQGHFLSSNSQ